MHKKGLSDTMSAVLLVGMTIVITLLAGSILLSVARESSGFIGSQAGQQLSCVYADFIIQNATFDAGMDCTKGVNHTLNVTIRNIGSQKMSIDNIIIESETGRIITFYLGKNISAGDIRTFRAIGNEECVSFISQSPLDYTNKIKSIRVSSESCPSSDYLPKEYASIVNANQTENMPSIYSVGLWHFNSSLSDISGCGNDGTFYGEASPSFSTGVSSSFGDAVSFDGQDDYVEVDDSSSLDVSEQFTIELWLYNP